MNELRVTIHGNVASALTPRQAPGGQVVSFRIVSNTRVRDQVSGEWRDGKRFSTNVSCWGRLGENVIRSLGKGDPVVVEGRLWEDEYESAGVRRWANQLTADHIGPDLARSRAFVTRIGGAGAALAGAPETAPVDVTGWAEVPDEFEDAPADVFALHPSEVAEDSPFAPAGDDVPETVTGRDALAG